MLQSVIDRLTSSAEKALRQRNKWRADVNSLSVMSDKYTRLHFKPFGQDF